MVMIIINNYNFPTGPHLQFLLPNKTAKKSGNYVLKIIQRNSKMHSGK
jgi:hypothetical protein